MKSNDTFWDSFCGQSTVSTEQREISIPHPHKQRKHKRFEEFNRFTVSWYKDGGWKTDLMELLGYLWFGGFRRLSFAPPSLC